MEACVNASAYIGKWKDILGLENKLGCNMAGRWLGLVNLKVIKKLQVKYDINVL
jgi:hypothetical protein